jgi:eukaryotic-like serine/threonine-protein kinase
MSPELLLDVEAAYSQVAHLEPGVRQEFLSRTYSNRPDIVSEVRSLLQHQSDADNFDRSIVATAAAEMLQDTDNVIGSIVGGRYLIRCCIGTGAQAEVYLADHIALKTPFALKRPKPELRDDRNYRHRFLEEARRAVLLKHDNVARVHDVVNEGADIFVVMEHVEGETLRARMKGMARPFTVSEFLPIAIQCAAALAAAHEKRIVHLDVKPENIMLTPSGQVKICDFGIARRLSATDNSNDTTAKSDAHWTFAGTPAYMAPEVILSQNFDERADLFSLGTVFYELLTGISPFLADTTIATATRVVSDIPEPISNLNPRVMRQMDRILHRLLAKNPEERYATAADIVGDLQAVRRSYRRLPDIVQSFSEAFAESRRVKFVAVFLILCVAATPPVWIFRYRVEQWFGIAALPGKRIIVVLPFRIIGESRGERFYSEGFSELLTMTLTQLATIPGLQVIPANEIRDKRVDTAERARSEFGATLVLAGTFEFSGEQVRVSYGLIDGVNRRELRGDSQTMTLGDPFTLQDKVNHDVVKMLEIALTPSSSGVLQSFGTRNPRAFFLYTEGRGALRNSQEIQNVDAAIDRFTQAVDLDNQYAMAYASLGEAYKIKFSISSEPAWIDQAERSCEKALTLNPGLGLAHACIGWVNETKGFYERALEDFGRAIAYEPTDDSAQTGLGRALERLGRFDEAEKAYLKAVEVRPQYWATHMWLGGFYSRRHDYSKAIEQYYVARAVSPDNGQVYLSLGGTIANSGQYDAAIPILQKAVQLRPYVEPYSNLGLTYLRARRYNEALPLLEKAVSLGENYIATGNLARIYWLTNQFDRSRLTYELAILQGEKRLQINPVDSDVHLLVGRYYAMLEKTPEAVGHLTLALKEHAKDPHYLMIAAVAYAKVGDPLNALNLIEQSVKYGFTSVQIRAEPELDVLRTEPRYIRLVSSTK